MANSLLADYQMNGHKFEVFTVSNVFFFCLMVCIIFQLVSPAKIYPQSLHRQSLYQQTTHT